jgi:hypothetical protein
VLAAWLAVPLLREPATMSASGENDLRKSSIGFSAGTINSVAIRVHKQNVVILILSAAATVDL